MLYIFHGADEFRVAEAVRALRASFDTDGMLATNTTTLAGRGLTPETLVQHASAMPFLGGARLVIVEGLIAAAGSRRGVVDAWQPFLDFLPHMPESTHVVLVEPAPPRRDAGRRGRGPEGSPLLNALRQRPNVQVTEFAELRTGRRGRGASEVEEWLRARAQARGIDIEPAASAALVDLVGATLRMLATELEKLATYAGDRPVTADDVRLLTPQAREESVFTLVDAVVEGRGAAALRLLHRMLEEESQTPAMLQAMLARQVRLIVRAAEVLAQGRDQRAVGEATGVRADFPLRKLVGQARAVGREPAVEALRAIERSDHRVKTGRLDDDLALEMLVVRLASLMAPAGRARRGGRAAAGRP